jgi:superfamily II DNA helicase RecQ
MHSYGDRRTHDFFFSRDYPEVSLLERMFLKLHADPQPKEALQEALGIDTDLFDKALEKLWIHKGAVLDFAENVRRGDEAWRFSYIQQGEQKREQIDQMIRYTESHQCRMRALVRHFGDTTDSGKPCGVCDFCAPAKCVAQRFRTATEKERTALFRVLRCLQPVYSKSTGKLYTELYPEKETSRDNFEEILGAMARAGLLTCVDAVFEKEGKPIPYRTVSLTPGGKAFDQSIPLDFVMKDAARPVATSKRRKHPGVPAKAAPRSRPMQTEAGTYAARANGRTGVEEALRIWRLGEAKKRNIPAFRIFGDLALRSIAAACPQNEAELLALPAVGTSIAKKYGRQIYRLITDASPRGNARRG